MKSSSGNVGTSRETVIHYKNSVKDSEKSPSQKRLLTQRIAKDTGVKRQIIVAVAEKLSETYVNVQQIWPLIGANDVKLIISCDLKMENIMLGLQSHKRSSILAHGAALIRKF